MDKRKWEREIARELENLRKGRVEETREGYRGYPISKRLIELLELDSWTCLLGDLLVLPFDRVEPRTSYIPGLIEKIRIEGTWYVIAQRISP